MCITKDPALGPEIVDYLCRHWPTGRANKSQQLLDALQSTLEACVECGLSPDDWIPAEGAQKSVLRRMFRLLARLVREAHFTLANQAFTVSDGAVASDARSLARIAHTCSSLPPCLMSRQVMLEPCCKTLLQHHKNTFVEEIGMIKAATHVLQHGDDSGEGRFGPHFHEDVRKGAQEFRKHVKLF